MTFKTARLGDLVQNLNSRRVNIPRRERELRPGVYPYYGSNGVIGHIDDYLFDGLYILVAEDGQVAWSNGRPILHLVSGRFWVSPSAHVIQADTDDDTRFIYYALSTVDISPYVAGSVQAHFSKANLDNLAIVYPDDAEERRTIVRILGTLDDKIEQNRQMGETLAALRDALLPQLLRGDLRAPRGAL